MPSDWSNENSIKFLELLETEKVIWDVNDNNHKLKHKVHDAWKRIGDALDIPIEELKSKKKSLMATFRPLLKKKHNSIRSGADADEIFNPIWFAFDIMERFLGPTFTVDDTVNTEDEFLKSNTSPPTQDSNESETTPLKSPQTKVIESSQRVYNTATKIAKKRQIDNIMSDADKKLNDSFATLSQVLQRKKGEEDECDVYASLLAKKLRKYPERMRDTIMYMIDGLLLDNPYPDERPSSASLSSPYAQHPFSTPSPQYAPTPSPQYALIPSPQYAPTRSPQYAPTQSPQYAPTRSPQYAPTPFPQYVSTSSSQCAQNSSTYVLTSQNCAASTSQAPVYLHIPEENINMQNEVILQSSSNERRNIAQEELRSQLRILSQKVIVPAEMRDKNAYNDS